MTGLALGALHVALLLGLVAWLAATAPDARAAWTRVGVVGAASFVFVAILALVDPHQIALDVLIPVREGSTDVTVRVARGEGAGAGIAHTHGYLPWFCGTRRSLDVVVRMNLAFLGATLVLLTALGRRVTGAWVPSVLLTVVFALSIPVRAAVSGAGPAPVLWVLLLIGGAGLTGWWQGERAVTRWGGLAIVALATVAVSLSRVEVAALLVVPALLALPHRWGWGDRWVASLRHRRVAWGAGAVAVLGLAIVTYGPVTRWIAHQGQAAWVLQALHPLAASTLTLGPIEASMWPLGVVVLAVLGGVRTPARNLGLGLATFGVLRVYHAAAHGDFYGTPSWAWPLEMLRYNGLVAPILVVLAWWGWVSLPRGATRAAALALVVVPAQPWMWPAGRGDDVRGPLWDAWGRMDLDAQQEVRALVAGMRMWPTCGFVTLGAADPGDGRRVGYAWRSTWDPAVDATTRRLVVLPDVDDPEAMADAVPGRPSCVMLYAGMGCATPGDTACAAWPDTYQVIDEDTVPAAPHAHPDHGWDTSDPWTRRWMRLR